MNSPILAETDTVVKGTDCIRNLNTGTLDISDKTPRLSLLKRRDGTSAGEVKWAKVDGSNLAYVIPHAVTSTLDYSSYLLNISFDDPAMNYRIPFAVVAYTVAMGEPFA